MLRLAVLGQTVEASPVPVPFLRTSVAGVAGIAGIVGAARGVDTSGGCGKFNDAVAC